jgi:hypothetical protein
MAGTRDFLYGRVTVSTGEEHDDGAYQKQTG